MSIPKGQYMLQRRQVPHSVNAMRAISLSFSGDTLPSRLISSQRVFFTFATGANMGSLSRDR